MQVESNFTSSKASTWSGILRGIKKGFLVLSTLIVVVAAIFIYVNYFHTSGNGYRTGILQKFSHEGNLIKTYEGELILKSVAGNLNISGSSEKFYFSVTSNALANQLDTIQGQMVIVHYQQKNAPFFLHGDSEYLVDGVKRTP